MRKTLNKIALALGFVLLASNSFAETATTTVNLGGTVNPGCVFTQTSYTASFGTVAFGTVPKASVELGIICSNELHYTLRTVQNPLTIYASGTSESLSVRVYSDNSYTTQIDNTNGITGMGNGAVQNQTVYFKILNNAYIAPDLGEGAVVLQPATISASIDFVLVY